MESLLFGPERVDVEKIAEQDYRKFGEKYACRKVILERSSVLSQQCAWQTFPTRWGAKRHACESDSRNLANPRNRGPVGLTSHTDRWVPMSLPKNLMRIAVMFAMG